MKIVTGLAVLGLAVPALMAAPAAAKLTPNDGLAVVHAVDMNEKTTATAAALNEHDYFQAPPHQDPYSRAYRCTVRAVVFEKIRLAQACY